MRASFTDARGNSPRDAPKQRYPSAAADELSAEDQAEISRAGLQSSAAASRQKRNSAAQGGGYQQPKPLELTVHSIRMLAHEQKDRHVLPGAQLGNLPAEVYARAKLTASTVTFDWSHTLKLDAQGQEAGVLRDVLFPRRADGQKAPPRLPVTAASEVPDSVRKAFTMFDFDHSGDIDSRELRKALEAMGMETDESQTRGVLAKYDRSGKGALTLVEFNKLVQEILEFQKKQEVRSRRHLPAISMTSSRDLHAISPAIPMRSPCDLPSPVAPGYLRRLSIASVPLHSLCTPCPITAEGVAHRTHLRRTRRRTCRTRRTRYTRRTTRRTRCRYLRTCARPSPCSTRTGAVTSTDTSSSRRCGSSGWRRTRCRCRASSKSTTRRAAASWTWPRSTSW